MTSAVIDASVILAFVNRETGWERAKAAVTNCRVSSVNVAEVVTRLRYGGGSPAKVEQTIEELRLTIDVFDKARAIAAGLLIAKTRHLRLSLADRACLALGMELDLPVFTADRAWRSLDFAVDVRLIR